jgi:hypothetical protein
LALALEVSRRIREHILATSHKLGPFPRELEAPDGDGEVESQIAGEG